MLADEAAKLRAGDLLNAGFALQLQIECVTPVVNGPLHTEKCPCVGISGKESRRQALP